MCDNSTKFRHSGERLFFRAFYQDAARNWRGIGLRVLLLLELITWSAVLIQWSIGFSRFVTDEAPTALKDFPPIKIENGVASSDVPQPYFMRDEKGQAIFVLDTTGQVQSPRDVGARILLTQRELIQINSGGVVESRPLSNFPNMTVDRDTLLHWMGIARNWLIPGGVLFCGGFSTIFRLLFALALAALGLAFNASFKAGLSYPALLRLTMLAMIGPTFLDTLLWMAGISTACWGWFLFGGLTIGYQVFAIHAASRGHAEPPDDVIADPAPTPDALFP